MPESRKSSNSKARRKGKWKKEAMGKPMGQDQKTTPHNGPRVKKGRGKAMGTPARKNTLEKS